MNLVLLLASSLVTNNFDDLRLIPVTIAVSSVTFVAGSELVKRFGGRRTLP